jgi:hypothetical protein
MSGVWVEVACTLRGNWRNCHHRHQTALHIKHIKNGKKWHLRNAGKRFHQGSPLHKPTLLKKILCLISLLRGQQNALAALRASPTPRHNEEGGWAGRNTMMSPTKTGAIFSSRSHFERAVNGSSFEGSGRRVLLLSPSSTLWPSAFGQLSIWFFSSLFFSPSSLTHAHRCMGGA